MFRSISLFLVTMLVLLGCGGSKKKLLMPDSTRWTDQDVPLDELPTGSVNTDSLVILDNMRSQFSAADSIIEGRPVSFYLNRADVSQTAKDFYSLRFIPSGNDATFALCDSILSSNDTTRPFYYFLFTRMMRIADGGLAEGMSDYAVKYILQYPKEFYKRLKEPLYKELYNNWVEFAASTLMLPGIKNPTADEVRSYIIKEQTKKIKGLTASLRNEMEAFADTVAKMQEKNR